MRNRNTSETSPEVAVEISTDEDRYPDLASVFRRILAETDLGEGPVERIEVNCLASGEASLRVWGPRAEEPEGSYLPPA